LWGGVDTWRRSDGGGSVVEFLAAGDECGGLVLGYFFLVYVFGCRIIFLSEIRILPELTFF